MRTSRNQVKSRKPPLAVWNCCHVRIENWQDHWSSRDRKIPFEIVDSGCKDGQWNEFENDSNEDEDVYFGNKFARVAKKRSTTHSR